VDGRLAGLAGLSTETERQKSGGFRQYVKSKADTLRIDGIIQRLPASKVAIVIFVEREKDGAMLDFLKYLRDLAMVEFIRRTETPISHEELSLVEGGGFLILRSESLEARRGSYSDMKYDAFSVSSSEKTGPRFSDE
jgi:acylphosphatase